MSAIAEEKENTHDMSEEGSIIHEQQSQEDDSFDLK
jgi:hypothetical protein